MVDTIIYKPKNLHNEKKNNCEAICIIIELIYYMICEYLRPRHLQHKIIQL